MDWRAWGVDVEGMNGFATMKTQERNQWKRWRLAKIGCVLKCYFSSTIPCSQRSVRYHYSAMEKRKKERSGKKREPQVLPLRRKQSYNSFLTNSWNFSKKATKTWKKQNGIRKKKKKKKQRKQRKCGGDHWKLFKIVQKGLPVEQTLWHTWKNEQRWKQP